MIYGNGQSTKSEIDYRVISYSTGAVILLCLVCLVENPLVYLIGKPWTQLGVTYLAVYGRRGTPGCPEAAVRLL